MFNAITLENFKGFGQRQRIELAPLTLIYGQNSAGKSSILQAISLMQQTRANREQNAVLLPRAHAGIVNLGSFRDMIFEHNEKNQLCIGFELTLNRRSFRRRSLQSIINIYFRSGDKSRNVELSRLEIGSNHWGSVPIFERTRLTDKDRKSFLESAIKNRKYDRRYDSGYKLDSITDYFKPISISRSSGIWDYLFGNAKKGAKSITNALSELRDAPARMRGQISDSALRKAADFYAGDFDKQQFIHRMIQNEKKTKLMVAGCLPYYESRHFPYHAYHHRTPEIFALDEFEQGRRIQLAPHCVEAAAGVGHLLDETLKQVIHLGPFRQEPDRFYVRSATTPNDVGYKGENFPSLVGDHQALLTGVNQWLEKLETGYQIELASLSEESELFQVRLIDLKHSSPLKVGLTDVGFGISQIIPIIVQALFSQRKTILIEQPEVHVHPRLQADIADLFVESAKPSGRQANQFIIETHSEHLMLRIRKLIHEKKLLPKNVAVIWVGRSAEGAMAQRLRIDDNGDFIDPWPNGFFPERMREFF